MIIKQVPADKNNFGAGRNGKSVNKIVLHWIVGTLESADDTFRNPNRLASAHYGIGDTEIHQYVKEEDTAWHASNLEINRESIGIEHEGGWLLQDGSRFKPTEETLKTSALLVADICRRYSIPIDKDHIFPHNKYFSTQCPGSLDIDRIITLAKQEDKFMQIEKKVFEELITKLDKQTEIIKEQAEVIKVQDETIQKKGVDLETTSNALQGTQKALESAESEITKLREKLALVGHSSEFKELRLFGLNTGLFIRL